MRIKLWAVKWIRLLFGVEFVLYRHSSVWHPHPVRHTSQGRPYILHRGGIVFIDGTNRIDFHPWTTETLNELNREKDVNHGKS